MKVDEMFKQKSCKNVDRFKFKGTMTKWPAQKQTLRTARNTQNNKTKQSYNKLYFCILWISFPFLFILFYLLQ